MKFLIWFKFGMNSQTFKYIPIIDYAVPSISTQSQDIMYIVAKVFFPLFFGKFRYISIQILWKHLNFPPDYNILESVCGDGADLHFLSCILLCIREGMLPRDCMPTCSSIVYVLFLFLKSSFQHGCLFKHILENYGFRVYKHSRWLSLME